MEFYNESKDIFDSPDDRSGVIVKQINKTERICNENKRIYTPVSGSELLLRSLGYLDTDML